MTEAEMRMLEAQQACKRIPCPHCGGSGTTVVSNRPLSGAGVDFLGHPIPSIFSGRLLHRELTGEKNNDIKTYD